MKGKEGGRYFCLTPSTFCLGSGAPDTNRTCDLSLRRGLLYPLSYRGVIGYSTNFDYCFLRPIFPPDTNRTSDLSPEPETRSNTRALSRFWRHARHT